MRHTRPIAAVCLATTALVALGFATQPVPNQSSPIIERKMGQMADSLSQVMDALRAEDAKTALRQLQIFQEAVIDSKAQTPGITKAQKPDQRNATTAAYRKSLVDVLAASCDLEHLIVDGDFESAKEFIGTTLSELEGAGHDEFRP